MASWLGIVDHSVRLNMDGDVMITYDTYYLVRAREVPREEES